MPDEYKRIQSYTMLRQVCDIIYITYESTSTVKRYRILKLYKDFKLYIMQEDETFDKFYAQL